MREAIFDKTRKKRVVLTPEEDVRQQLINTLTSHYGVPLQMICCEYSFKINNISYRCDLVVFNNKGKALLLAECKAPHIKITDKTMNQIFRYNQFLNVKSLLITNGNITYFANYNPEDKSITFKKEIPSYNELPE